MIATAPYRPESGVVLPPNHPVIAGWFSFLRVGIACIYRRNRLTSALLPGLIATIAREPKMVKAGTGFVPFRNGFPDCRLLRATGDSQFRIESSICPRSGTDAKNPLRPATTRSEACRAEKRRDGWSCCSRSGRRGQDVMSRARSRNTYIVSSRLAPQNEGLHSYLKR